MPANRDPAEVLQQIYAAGFELQTFERFPKAIGVVRGQVMVLLENSDHGLRLLGTAGWRMGEFMGVPTTVQGRAVFQWKTEVVEATPERLQLVEEFRQQVSKLLE